MKNKLVLGKGEFFIAKVVVVGGGWAGCAAAIGARKAGAKVILLERTDLLLGTGLVGGIMRNNGRFTAAEEAIAMGAGELFNLTDKLARHRNISFPGHSHALLYDIYSVEPQVRKLLESLGIELMLQARVCETEMERDLIKGVVTSQEEIIRGDVFIDTTGTGGGMNNCSKYGHGCCMCIIRCPAFGPRISLAAKAGVKEFDLEESAVPFQGMSGSCKIAKESLSPVLVERLDKEGVVVIPLRKKVLDDATLKKKSCQQYSLPEFKNNLIILDTGEAKLMAPFFPLHLLREIEGLEKVRFLDPYGGGKGNSMRFIVITPRENTLLVEGIKNLFCAGEKVGLLVGHTEAIITGSLAGFNAAALAGQKSLLELSRTLASGDLIAFIKEKLAVTEGLAYKYTFSGSVYFERMKELELYTTDIASIQKRVAQSGLTGIYQQKIV